jgi:hypothetical protein
MVSARQARCDGDSSSLTACYPEAGTELAEFDWRAATALNLTEEQRQTKLVFRGSGGYCEFRRQEPKHLADYQGDVGVAANNVLSRIA